MPAPIRSHSKFVVQSVFVNPRLNEQTGPRLRNFYRVLSNEVALVEFSSLSAKSHCPEQRLCAPRTYFIGRQERTDDLGIRVAQTDFQASGFQQTDKHLLAPKA